MSLSGEDIELADPATPTRRKLQIRLKRLFSFVGTTGLMMLAVCLIGLLSMLIYFTLPFIGILLFGESA